MEGEQFDFPSGRGSCSKGQKSQCLYCGGYVAVPWRLCGSAAPGNNVPLLETDPLSPWSCPAHSAWL